MSDELALKRKALSLLSEAITQIRPALNGAPHGIAQPVLERLDTLAEDVAAELGLELLGQCEGCDEPVFEGDVHMLTDDICWLCETCMPSEEDIERQQAEIAAEEQRT